MKVRWSDVRPDRVRVINGRENEVEEENERVRKTEDAMSIEELTSASSAASIRRRRNEMRGAARAPSCRRPRPRQIWHIASVACLGLDQRRHYCQIVRARDRQTDSQTDSKRVWDGALFLNNDGVPTPF